MNILVKGGLETLKEIPGQDKIELEDKYFDRYATYSPFPWLGSRRLTKIELEDISTTKKE